MLPAPWSIIYWLRAEVRSGHQEVTFGNGHIKVSEATTLLEETVTVHLHAKNMMSAELRSHCSFSLFR